MSFILSTGGMCIPACNGTGWEGGDVCVSQHAIWQAGDVCAFQHAMVQVGVCIPACNREGKGVVVVCISMQLGRQRGAAGGMYPCYNFNFSFSGNSLFSIFLLKSVIKQCFLHIFVCPPSHAPPPPPEEI